VTPDSSAHVHDRSAAYQPAGCPPQRREPSRHIRAPAHEWRIRNIYTPHAGSMIIQVQRESGLQSRTSALRRQIRSCDSSCHARKTHRRRHRCDRRAPGREAARIPVLTAGSPAWSTLRSASIHSSIAVRATEAIRPGRTMMGSDAPADGEHAECSSGIRARAAIQTAPSETPTHAPRTHRFAGRTATARQQTRGRCRHSLERRGRHRCINRFGSGRDGRRTAAPRPCARGGGRHTAVRHVPPPPDSGTPPSPGRAQ